MIPRRKKHIAKPVKPLFDPGAFYKDFHNETVVKARLAQLEKLGMDEIQSKRGWIGYELPNCSWHDNWKPSTDVSNYRCWPAEARGWIVQIVDGSGNNTCMLRRKAVYEMPEKEWEELMNTVDKLKHDYPYLDENDHSEVESEGQDKEWDETYREEFQKGLAEKFDGVFSTMAFGDRIEDKFAAMIEDDNLTDQFFYELRRNDGRGRFDELWTEAADGDWSCDVSEIIDAVDTQTIIDYVYPEDPRQMKFKFMARAESLVKEMLNDDLMVMVDSPLADRIVDSLLEDHGPHSYSCVMINLPEDLANQIMAWGKLQVKDEDVVVDEKGGKGRENEPHVTLKYGLLDSEPTDALLQVFEHTAPFDVKLGRCSLFKNPENDVVKLDVVSPGLHALNSNVCAVVAYEDEYTIYSPHVTIAYVNPTTCDRLEGASPWDNPVKMGVTDQEGVFTVREVVFSSTDGSKTVYKLGQSAQSSK